MSKDTFLSKQLELRILIDLLVPQREVWVHLLVYNWDVSVNILNKVTLSF